MSGVLNRQFNTLAGRSRHAVAAAATAAAAARHHGRTPFSSSSSTVALASIARKSSSSSLAGCASGSTDGGTNTAASNYAGNADYRRAPAAAQAAPAATASTTATVGMGAESTALSSSPSSGTAVPGGGARRAASSIAASSPGARTASPPTSSLLAPAASAYSSSSLLPSASADCGGGGGGRATRVDAVVIGAGQAGLSVAYHLQKAGGLRVVALDANQVNTCYERVVIRRGFGRRKGFCLAGWCLLCRCRSPGRPSSVHVGPLLKIRSFYPRLGFFYHTKGHPFLGRRVLKQRTSEFYFSTQLLSLFVCVCVCVCLGQEPGGAWRHRWPSLELFSTRKWSSLPGYPMFANAACEDGYPTTGEMAM